MSNSTAQPSSVSRGFFQNLLGNGLVMLLSLVIGGLSARLLGVEGKGELAAIQLLPHLIFVVAVMGVHEATVYHVARGQFPTPTVFGAGLAVTAPFALAGVGVSALLTRLVLHRYPPSIVLTSQLYAAFILVALAHGVMQRVLQGKGYFGWWNVFRVGLQFGSLAVLLAIWMMDRLSAVMYASGILVLNGVVLLAAVGVLAHLGLLKARFDWTCVKALWRYAWRAGIGNVPQLLNARLDQVLIAMLLSTQSLGLYSTAVSWSLGFVPLADAYANVVFPRIASERGEEGRASFVRFVRVGLALLSVAWVVYFAITPVAFGAIFGPAFTAALPSARILVVASLLLGVNGVLSLALKGLGRPLIVSASEMVGLGVTVPLVLVLVRRYDIFGAAIASLGAYAVTALVLLVGVRRNVKPTWRELLLIQREEWWAFRDLVRRWWGAKASAVGM